MYLSIIIPAYNEEHRIGPTLQSVGLWLAQQSFDGEVLVIDNNSHDGTSQVVASYMEQYPSIRAITERRQGKGYAVQCGMLAAQGDVRLFMDADNSTSIDHFERCMPHLHHGYDVVIGSLAVRGSTIMQGGAEPLWRRILGKLGNLWIQLFAVPGIWDTRRGFKVFTARAANDVFHRLTIFGWSFDDEVLAIARLRGYRIKEIPVTWNNDPNSKINFWAYPKTLGEAVRIGWNRLIGTYRAEMVK